MFVNHTYPCKRNILLVQNEFVPVFVAILEYFLSLSYVTLSLDAINLHHYFITVAIALPAFLIISACKMAY